MDYTVAFQVGLKSNSAVADLVPIGEAARRLGLNTSTLRYYEERGLVRPVTRRHGSRMYGPQEIRRLAFVRAAQRLGMALDDIAVILSGPSARWRDVVRGQVRALDEQIERAGAAREFLGHALRCPSEHPVDECPHLGEVLDRQVTATDG
ncbi:MerR family transcriptional regulator [Micromonospora sp. SL1-18]|uniref:MerR family transcriptional regulator n=1 Tax=Micromonospora sp. SL1-18 TaxID=3399128 RepID=UPI003A4D2C3F